MDILKKTFDILHLTHSISLRVNPEQSRRMTSDRIKKLFNCQLSIVNCHKGFTLVEILLFLLLVLAMTTILLSSASSLFKTRGVNLESYALEIANRDIENLKNSQFSTITGGAISDPDLSAKLPTGSTATRTVANYQSSPKIKQITIQVDWTERSIAKQIQMETLLYESGL